MSLFLLPLAVALSSCASLSPALKGLGADTAQVVVVVPAGPKVFQATLSAWERSSGGWQRVLGPWPAVIGRNGFAPAGEKREGDGRTPSGVYHLDLAFGRESGFKTGLAYRQATPEDTWVDDVASPQYNQWVRGVPEAKSFEQMLRPDGLYDAGAVIEYNTDPIVPGKGSAIFLHIWRDKGQKPTAGCVALPEERVRKILKWLDAERAPVIILGG